MTERESTEGKIEKVTVFEDRAEVIRAARVEGREGARSVTIRGLSAVVDDTSVVARPRLPGVRVTASRVVRRVREEAAAGEAELAALEGEAQRAREQWAAAERARDRAGAELSRARSLEGQLFAAVSRVPRSMGAARGDWRASFTGVEEAATRALDDQLHAQLAFEDAQRELVRVEARLSQARRRQPRVESEVELELEAPSAEPFELELVYRVPCAVWRPEHLATLEGTRVTLRTFAVVWQATGERWSEVPLSFSTARPAREATPPTMGDDVLALRKKTEQEKRQVVVEARDQSIARAGAEGSRAVAEMPGVDDGGEPLSFSALRPASVPSDGAPVRVEIASVELPAALDRVAMPEVSAVVSLRARLTHRGPTPLLAGPVVVVRGGALMGRGKLDFVGAGAPFELGFGPDDGVRARRTRTDKRETTPIVGTQRITRTITVFLSNTSDQPKELAVIERYPVSELGDVTVQVLEHAGATLEPTDGFARYQVQLEARGTKELKLVYRVEAAAKVQLRI